MRTNGIIAVAALAGLALAAGCKKEQGENEAAAAAKPAAAAPAAAPAFPVEAPDSLKALTRITVDSAAKLATAQVAGGVIQKAELEREKNALNWSFDLKVQGQEGISEVNVNAVTANPNNVAQDYALVISSGDGDPANVLHHALDRSEAVRAQLAGPQRHPLHPGIAHRRQQLQLRGDLFGRRLIEEEVGGYAEGSRQSLDMSPRRVISQPAPKHRDVRAGDLLVAALPHPSRYFLIRVFAVAGAHGPE